MKGKSDSFWKIEYIHIVDHVGEVRYLSIRNDCMYAKSVCLHACIVKKTDSLWMVGPISTIS